jgi:hypothetical protein
MPELFYVEYGIRVEFGMGGSHVAKAVAFGVQSRPFGRGASAGAARRRRVTSQPKRK